MQPRTSLGRGGEDRGAAGGRGAVARYLAAGESSPPPLAPLASTPPSNRASALEQPVRPLYHPIRSPTGEAPAPAPPAPALRPKVPGAQPCRAPSCPQRSGVATNRSHGHPDRPLRAAGRPAAGADRQVGPGLGAGAAKVGGRAARQALAATIHYWSSCTGGTAGQGQHCHSSSPLFFSALPANLAALHLPLPPPLPPCAARATLCATCWQLLPPPARAAAPTVP